MAEDYDSRLKADLEADATARGIDISDNPTKSTLIARLERHDREQARAQREAPPEVTQPIEVPPGPEGGPPGLAGAPPPGQAEGGPPAGGRPRVDQRAATTAGGQEVRAPAPYPSDDDLATRLDAAAGRTEGEMFDTGQAEPVGGQAGDTPAEQQQRQQSEG